MATLPAGRFTDGPLVMIPDIEEQSSIGATINFDLPLFWDVEFSVSLSRPSLAGLAEWQRLLVPGVVIAFDGGTEVRITETTQSFTAPAGTKQIKILSRHHVKGLIAPSEDDPPGPEMVQMAPFNIPRLDARLKPYTGGPFPTSDVITLSVPEDDLILPTFGSKQYSIAVDRGFAGVKVLKDFNSNFTPVTPAESGGIEYNTFIRELVWDQPLKGDTLFPDTVLQEMMLYRVWLRDYAGNSLSEGKSAMLLNELQSQFPGHQMLPIFSMVPASNFVLASRVYWDGLYNQALFSNLSNATNGRDNVAFNPEHKFIKLLFQKTLQGPYLKTAAQAWLDRTGGSPEGILLLDIFRLSIERTAITMPGSLAPAKTARHYDNYIVMKTIGFEPA